MNVNGADLLDSIKKSYLDYYGANGKKKLEEYEYDQEPYRCLIEICLHDCEDYEYQVNGPLKKIRSEWAIQNDLDVLAEDSKGEGQGEECWIVWSWLGKTYRAEYSYYSHDGHHYYGIESTIKEVKPVEKTITVWENVG